MSGPDDEDVLRRLLAEEARRADPQPDWDDVQRRARRTDGPSRWLSVAAVLVAGAVLGLVLVTRGAEDEAGVVADDPAGTTTAVKATTSTTAPTTTVPASVPSGQVWTVVEGPDVPSPLEGLAAGDPLGADEVVAAIDVPSDDDFPAIDVVVLSKRDGQVVRTLATGYDSVEGGVYGITLSPDRRHAFWVVAETACTNHLEVAPVDGSADPVRFRDDANGIAFGGNGSYALEVGEMCATRATIEVGDVAGGATAVYRSPSDDQATLLSMAIDDRYLYGMPSGTTGGPAQQLHVVDRRNGEVRIVPGAFSDVRSSVGSPALDVGASVHALHDGALVTLSGPRTADVALDVPDAAVAALVDHAGDLLVLVAEERAPALYLGDRLVRRGVLAVGS